jgi:hypothetical protein
MTLQTAALQYVVSGFRLRRKLRRTTVALAKVVSRTLAIAIMLGLAPALTFAQTSERRTEVGGDLRWLTGLRFSDVNATEAAFGGTTRTVFKSSTEFEQAACPDARVAVRLMPAIDAEGAVTFGRTHLTTQITQDPEAANVTVSEPVTVYLLEAGVAAHPARWHRGRSSPFVSGGIGYLRQLHDGHTLVEGGRTWYVGGGLRYPMKAEAVHGMKSAVVRLELRATILTGSSALDGATHILPAVIAGVFFHL